MEAEDFTDNGTVIGIADDVIEDLLDQCIPASVVLLFLAFYLAREAMGFWLKLKSGRADDHEH